jgi:hypothetical protein
MGDDERIKKVIKDVFSKAPKRKEWSEPISTHKIIFDSPQSQLEPIYYWLLDFIQDGGWDAKKVTDNFMSSPGSGHFSEMGMKATKMQEEGMKILGGLNQTIKSALNLVYDLKEFELRLKSYKDAESEDAKVKSAGILALKQIWLDNVDMKRGRGAIHQMSNEMGFTTLREAFLIANSLEDLEKMNSNKGGGIINDSVKRILEARVQEFLNWRSFSEKELQKRMNIEKSYLRSQVETIKLYSAWMKPYLDAAEQLRQKGFSGNAALVNAFSTSMFELTLIAKKSSKVPDQFGGYKLKRDYHPVMIVNIKYRGHVSQRVTQAGDQGFAMGGRIEMNFNSYALNSEEMKLVEDKLTAEDVADSMNMEGNMAADALKELKEDLEYFLGKDEKAKEKDEKEKKDKEKENDINPFGALIGLFWKKKQKKKDLKDIKEITDVQEDNYVEKAVRAESADSAAGGVYKLYDIYKKTHDMASSPEDFENKDTSKTGEPGVKFKDIFKNVK